MATRRRGGRAHRVQEAHHLGDGGPLGDRLGRDAELGTLEVGKLADIAVWRVDGLAGNGIADPVCTLVFGAPTLAHLFVGGRAVVRDGELRTADAEELAAVAGRAAARIARPTPG